MVQLIVWEFVILPAKVIFPIGSAGFGTAGRERLESLDSERDEEEEGRREEEEGRAGEEEDNGTGEELVEKDIAKRKNAFS